MKFTVTYHECYSGEYEVEANSKEEAEELVKEYIFNVRRTWLRNVRRYLRHAPVDEAGTV